MAADGKSAPSNLMVVSASAKETALKNFKKRKHELPLPSKAKKSQHSKGQIVVGMEVAAQTIEELQVAWIWGKVTRVVSEGREYEIEDVEDQKKMRKSIREIIPLRLSSLPEFPPGSTVLACYPNTTAFYKATVIRPPSTCILPRCYEVTFEDDQGKQQVVELVAEYDARKVEGD